MENILNIFGDYSSREIKRLNPIIKKIEALDEEFSKLSDEELRGKTEEFKERLKNGETLDDILPEAFATVREASFRVLGMKHYKVQLMGGIVLHQGRIAEMKTGEGKTLVSTSPAYLNALMGKGVHVITTNDYLANRDKEEMGRVHEFLGLKVGVILHDMKPEDRREAYNCDITYGTNNELGFDYLRDNMVMDKVDRVQRGLYYAVVDEIDSILIDEARTPLIISGAGDEPTDIYEKIDKFIKTLKEDEHYEIDEKLKAITLTESGIALIEETFNLENYADAENLKLQHHITQSLKANYIMIKNKEYIVKEGEIFIVDTFTGRVMEGRRFSEGLHQAIEAKEGVKIRQESKTLATITLQNYFRIYKKLSGMTGTGITEAKEFQEIYSLDVVVIPTNRPIARIDHKDVVYKNTLGKYNAIVEEIKESNEKGQPVLVGTSNIQKSEDLSFLLKRNRIVHTVLNAKNHEKEAKIVQNAGKKGAVTIATNMAGRGTDIKLGEGVAELGGLKVIGTDRHESRRIDNQLRGRAGRQGDPGSSRFYLSLEDDLIKNFTPERLKKSVEQIKADDVLPIEDNLIYKVVEIAQRTVEGNNFATRKDVVGYDDIINKQREVIYKQRNDILDKESIAESILSMIKESIEHYVELCITGSGAELEEGLHSFITKFKDITGLKEALNIEDIKGKNKKDIKELAINLAEKAYKDKEASLGEEVMRLKEKNVLLKVVDQMWLDHLDDLDHIKQGIKFKALRQIDPVQAYQLEGGKLFNEMIMRIKEETSKLVLN